MFEKYAGSLFTTARGRDERRFQATKRDAVGGHVHRALLRHDAGQRDIRPHPDEIQTVEAFAHKYFLTVKSSHAGLRHVVVEGTAAQFSNAFGVRFKRYELPPAPRRKDALVRRSTFRGRDGFPSCLLLLVLSLGGVAPVKIAVALPGV